MVAQGKSKNKGELSELYVLARLLSDRSIRIESGTKKSEELRIIRVIRRLDDHEIEYIINGAYVNVIHPNVLSVGSSAPEVSRDRLKTLAQELLVEIKCSRKALIVSEVAPAVELMTTLGLSKVSSSSKSKSDIGVVVYDPMLNLEVTRWFSIKSRLGSAPTLLNASGATWFKYELTGTLADGQIEELNEMRLVDLVKAVVGLGIDFVYVETDTRFRENLNLIDGHLEKIVAEALLESYLGKDRSVEGVLSRLEIRNPLGFSSSATAKAYKLKFTQLLQNVSLGMTPALPWDGNWSLTGGIIDVRRDGELDLYHPEDQRLLREYLLTSTRFETPDRGRHKFGFIRRENDKLFLNLNLQIRFK